MFHRKSKFHRKSIPCVFVGYPANDNGFKFYNPQTKHTLQSWNVISMEDKLNVEKSDCTLENLEFFSGLVWNAENDDAEWNK